jgi:RNA-directed DNA polymerase
MVLGFQHLADADRFLEELRERLAKFGLELHPDKTRRIEFGRSAEQDRKRRGEGEPETFDFLGFTHISGKTRNGSFAVKRHTIGKRVRGSWQKSSSNSQRMHEPVAATGKWLNSVVQGYFNYHAIPGNTDTPPRVPLSGYSAVAAGLDSSRSAALPELGTNGAFGGPLDPESTRSPSLAQRSL